MFSFEGTSVVAPCQCYPSQVVHIRCRLYVLTSVTNAMLRNLAPAAQK
jgi:hypothetical protein